MQWAAPFGTSGPTRCCAATYAAYWQAHHVKRSASAVNAGGQHWLGNAPWGTSTIYGAIRHCPSGKQIRCSPRMSFCASPLNCFGWFTSNNSGVLLNTRKSRTTRRTPWPHLYGAWDAQRHCFVYQAHIGPRFFKVILVQLHRSRQAWCSLAAAASSPSPRPITVRHPCQPHCAWARRGSTGPQPSWRSTPHNWMLHWPATSRAGLLVFQFEKMPNTSLSKFKTSLTCLFLT